MHRVAEARPGTAAEKEGGVRMTEIREQRSEIRSQGAGIAAPAMDDRWVEVSMVRSIGTCRVINCGKPATVNAEDGIYCRECYEEIGALLEWEQRQQEKREARELHWLLWRQEWKQRIRRAARWVYRWLWVPELVLVVAVVSYLGAVYSVLWLIWMGWF